MIRRTRHERWRRTHGRHKDLAGTCTDGVDQEYASTNGRKFRWCRRRRRRKCCTCMSWGPGGAWLPEPGTFAAVNIHMAAQCLSGSEHATAERARVRARRPCRAHETTGVLRDGPYSPWLALGTAASPTSPVHPARVWWLLKRTQSSFHDSYSKQETVRGAMSIQTTALNTNKTHRKLQHGVHHQPWQLLYTSGISSASVQADCIAFNDASACFVSSIPPYCHCKPKKKAHRWRRRRNLMGTISSNSMTAAVLIQRIARIVVYQTEDNDDKIPTSLQLWPLDMMVGLTKLSWRSNKPYRCMNHRETSREIIIIIGLALACLFDEYNIT